MMIISGTYFATATTTLALCVFGKNIVKKGDEVCYEYFVNDSMYGSFDIIQQRAIYKKSYSPVLVKVSNIGTYYYRD